MPVKSENIISVLIFLMVFGVYVSTLNSVFHANDSPETAACAYTLGIQHPPGYPLSSLTGKIFTFLKAGNPGMRISVQAAFFGAAACVLFFRIMVIVLSFNGIKKNIRNFVSFAVVLIPAFSYTFWSEALSAKGGIYTLNAFMLGAVIYSLFLWERKGEIKYFYLAAFLYGVSLGNHWVSMAAAAPALAVYAYMVIKEKKIKNSFKKISTAAAFVVPGIMIYLYLIIRSNNGAYLNWGDPAGLKQLLWVFFREEYTSMETARDAATVISQGKRAAVLLWTQLSAAGFLLFAAGAAASLKMKNKKVFILPGIVIAVFTGILTVYFNLKEEMIWIMDVFMIPVYMAMTVFIACAGALIMRHLEKKGKTAAGAAGIMILSVPLFLAAGNYKKADQSRYFYAYDYGMNLIKSIDTPGLAFLEGDFNVMPQMYFRHVEKKADFCPVTTIFLYVNWGLKNVKNECPGIKITSEKKDPLTKKINDIINSNYAEKEIFVSVFRKVFQEFYPRSAGVLAPSGLVMRMHPDRKGSLDKAEVNFRKMSYRNLIHDRLFLNNTTEFCISNYSSAFMETGNAYRSLGRRERALYYMKKAVGFAVQPNLAQSLTHLGIAYSDAGRYEKAVETYEKALEIDPEVIEARSNMIGVLNNMKRYDEAVEKGLEALKYNDNFSEIYNNLGIAYYYKGNKKKAVETLEKAVSLAPDNPMARQNLKAVKMEAE
ncbi:MAG: protein O-mannosyl-transferase family [Candidatus Goldiibacteriota bacterium]